MSDKEYIKAGVGLADGWSLPRNEFGVEYVLGPHFSMIMHFNSPVDWILDSIAAQLVRQVDALRTEDYQIALQSDFGCTVIWLNGVRRWVAEGPDRTLNTIKAIVDSGVLE